MGLAFWKRRPVRAKTADPPSAWAHDKPLLWWNKQEPFTLDMATKGVQIFGATGSVKSSGSGRLLATKYLKAGFGGLVLCAKNGETETWRQYAKLAGRSDDPIIFSPSAGQRFNFLNYEIARPGAGAGLTENVVQLFMAVAEIANRGSGAGGGQDESYWKRSLTQLMRNAVDLLALTTKSVSVPDLYRVVISAANSLAETKCPAWQERSFCYRCLRAGEVAPPTGYRAHDFELVADYFLLEFPALSEKTRSIIVSTFTSMIDVFNRGILRELFCTTTTVSPEDIGRRKQLFASGNVAHSPYHPIDDYFQRDSGHVSGGWSESMEFEVQPAELCRMRTGGAANGFLIDGLVWRGGQPFASTGRSYLWSTFRQEV